MLRSCTADGKLMAVPFANSNMLLYYNEDALKEAGFDAPPAAWDELAQYTEALTKKGADGMCRALTALKLRLRDTIW